MSPGALRRRLQWPRPLGITIAAVGLVLAVGAIWASLAAMEAESDTPFLVAQALVAATVPTVALATVLAVVRTDRTRIDVAMAVGGPVLLMATVLAAWLMCFAAGLGGERCWWEDLDP